MRNSLIVAPLVRASVVGGLQSKIMITDRNNDPGVASWHGHEGITGPALANLVRGRLAIFSKIPNRQK